LTQGYFTKVCGKLFKEILMFFKILFMATFLIFWLRKNDQNQDLNGDEENSFSKYQPDKVFFFGILI
jgi:hypothetical protein